MVGGRPRACRCRFILPHIQAMPSVGALAWYWWRRHYWCWLSWTSSRHAVTLPYATRAMAHAFTGVVVNTCVRKVTLIRNEHSHDATEAIQSMIMPLSLRYEGSANRHAWGTLQRYRYVSTVLPMSRSEANTDDEIWRLH